jgi:hypothetical protein
MQAGALQQGGRRSMAWRWVRSGAASLVLATVAGGVAAQDLDAGKSAQQLFSSACTACHRGPQGLAKGRSPGAIAGFLAQHYTSGKRSAGELGAYLAAVGGDKPAPARGAAPAAPAATEPKPGAAAPPGREAGAKPAPARAAAEQQRQEAARVPAMRPRRPGEPATVAADPDPVVLSSEPMPLMHARAASRAQEQRQPPPVARTAALPVPTAVPAAPAAPVAPMPAPTPAVADGPPPAAPAAATGGPESAPAADVPAAAGVPAAAAAEAAAAARQVFSAPLP